MNYCVELRIFFCFYDTNVHVFLKLSISIQACSFFFAKLGQLSKTGNSHFTKAFDAIDFVFLYKIYLRLITFARF